MFQNLKRLVTRPLVPLALAALVAVPVAGWLSQSSAAEPPVAIPAPVVDEPAGNGLETAIFAGGCFWGVQGVFQHVAGVESAISGYAGGTLKNPSYEDVTTETTGHAESVKVTFDPKKVTYGKLLQIFFSVVHNPTQLNYQGPDHGPSYRSALFVMNDAQKKVAEAYIAQLDAAKVFPARIVTEVTPYTNFYQAEDYHQDATTTISINPGYITYNDLPKIENLRKMFPEVWQEKAKLVFASNAS
ncbi:MAG TPA: peptide-methionine (S)-S-oxide reductase MsrA [Bauldia sp.]|nr:peptide-methionine (S)-S-oxide reductase MsrA [Bauldia sp.]